MENKNTARIKEIKKLLAHNSLNESELAFNSRPIKIGKKISLETKDNPLLERRFLYKEELRRILLTTNDLKDIPQSILLLPPFKSFEVCHLLVHEKGKPVGHNYSFSRGSEGEIKLIPVQNFNALFNFVKKSKNKIFQQSPTTKDDLSILGSFLAKEIDFKNFSTLIFISKNSFLPPDEEELATFQELTLFLAPLLSRLLDKEKNFLKKDLLHKSLQNFPESIKVKKDNQIIFSNHHEQSDEKGNVMIFPFENSDSFFMELSNFKEDQIEADLYHSQRVSLLGELLNTLQHELSNPLFGLNLASSLLKSEAQNADSEELLEEISQCASRSQTIIKNFSHLYSDKNESKVIKIYHFIAEVMTLTKSETKEIPKSIECVGFETEDVSTIEVSTNPTYLTQIIFNLIINAAQAIKSASSEPRKHSIKVKLTNQANAIELAVVDDGPGVSQEHSQSIFDPFFTTKDSGTGLGLAICQNLAKKIGTNIEFKNNSPLLGATFSIKLLR